MIEIEPNWLDLTTVGSEYEEQVDVNASPGSPLAWRHRVRRGTGVPQASWTPGCAPVQERKVG